MYAPWASDLAAPVFLWLRALYRGGILHPQYASLTSEDTAGMLRRGECGMIVAAATNPRSFGDVRALVPPAGLRGRPVSSADVPAFHGVPRTAGNAQGAFELLEFLEDDEAVMLTQMGILGLDYRLVDGTPVATSPAGEERIDMGLGPVRFWDPPWRTDQVRSDAHAIALSAARPIDDHGRDGKAFSREFASAANRIIRGEINVYDGLAELRQRLASLGITDR